MFDELGMFFDPTDERFMPCPFCGNERIHHESMRSFRFARCQICSATGGYVFDYEAAPMTRHEVVLRWNTRQKGGDNATSIFEEK